jgi:hypothetical protein
MVQPPPRAKTHNFLFFFSCHDTNENLTEVENGFLLLTQVPPMIQIKTQVLNLKTLKTQVPMEYLTLFFIYK